MKAISLTPAVYDYLLAHSLRESDVQRRLREATDARSDGSMQACPEVAQFLGLLVELTGARRCLEVGVFTGYSTLAMALALPADGRVVACDIDAGAPAVGERYWREAGVAERIELRIGDARETLHALIEGGGGGSYDLAFLDADKKGYAGYFEQILALLRPRGLLVVDNVLWHGAVAEAGGHGECTAAIRSFNDKVYEDRRVSVSMLAVGDGLTLAVKRG